MCLPQRRGAGWRDSWPIVEADLGRRKGLLVEEGEELKPREREKLLLQTSSGSVQGKMLFYVGTGGLVGCEERKTPEMR